MQTGSRSLSHEYIITYPTCTPWDGVPGWILPHPPTPAQVHVHAEPQNVTLLGNRKLQMWLAKRALCLTGVILSCSVTSVSLQPHQLNCSVPGSSVHGDSPSKNTGVGCYALLQGIFPTQGLSQIAFIAGRFFTVWATKEAHI